MARIPYCDIDQLEQVHKDFFSRIPGGLNIFKMVAHAGDVGMEFVKLGASILYRGSVPVDLRELAIIRTGILCRSSYEVHQHRAIARKIGIPEEKIAALETGSSSPEFTPTESLVLRFTEELVSHNKVSAKTFSEMLKSFSHRQITELSIVAGYYRLVSSFLETFEVDIEPTGTF